MSPHVAARFGAIALLAVPVVAGATYAAATDTDIASAWSSDTAAAPAAPAAIDDSLLVDARRAAGEAGSQAGFLKQGTGQLVDGTGQLADGAKQLADGATSAKDGAAALSQGMVELQAGTGQLGAGATQVADGVGAAVDQVVGLEAARGQILGAVDRVLADTKDSKDPDVVSFRGQLESLRDQVTTFQLDESVTSQLTALRDGSRELANQLNTPGYAFHDGIYSATKGAKELSDGLNSLGDGIDEALSGVDELNTGATKIDTMATTNKDKIDAVTRALPAAQAGTAQADEAGITRSLPPMYAFLLAVGVLLVAAFGARRTLAQTLLAGVALAVLTGGLVWLLGTGIGAVLALTSAGIAGLLFAATALAGPILGKAAPALAVLQTAVVGWVWTHAATSPVSTAWQFVAGLMPVHYSTTAISALGNGGSSQAVWLSIAVLAALAAAGGVATRWVGQKAAVQAEGQVENQE
ncbi:hypothetical protein PAB09_01365 [Corynebacterium sp. SCR221107]|uniref:hypothetical protein n=1 Tax=Corynebacterium sp. SCR221107 TaxID=3017361 RepID=UPI0022EC7BA7|nr:hypothetical protein [Corynebacterium sp. SCR221107]WBT09026.1 hypothetical protein PAB09_01365 [Corynebacterium sp. SCR221107]